MSDPLFAPVPASEKARAFAVLVTAFIGDPVERWLYPEADHYLARFPALLAAFGGSAFDSKTVWGLSDYSAVALWMPPTIESDREAPDREAKADAITTVLAETVHVDKHHDLFAVLGRMQAVHPAYPHWYLPWFGVDAAVQGQGRGDRLMRSCLDITDVDGLPTYLETPNPRNISFYERCGFQVVGRAQVGECPPMTFMERPAP